MDSAALLHLITEPTRHGLLDALRDRERTVGQLVEAVQGEQTNVSHHLRTLRDAGLVKARRDGRRRVYRLADPALEGLLAEAEDLSRRMERVAYFAGLELPTGPAFHGYG